MYFVSSLQVSALPMTEYCKSQYEHRKQNFFQWRFLCFVMIKSKKVANWQFPYFLSNIGLKKCPGFQNMNSNQTFLQYLIKSRGEEVSFLTLYSITILITSFEMGGCQALKILKYFGSKSCLDSGIRKRKRPFIKRNATTSIFD